MGIFLKDGWTKTMFATFETTTYRSIKMDHWLHGCCERGDVAVCFPTNGYFRAFQHSPENADTNTHTHKHKSLQLQFCMQIATDSLTTTDKFCKSILGGRSVVPSNTTHSGFSVGSFMTKFSEKRMLYYVHVPTWWWLASRLQNAHPNDFGVDGSRSHGKIDLVGV